MRLSHRDLTLPALALLLGTTVFAPYGAGQEADSARVDTLIADGARADTLPDAADRARAMLDSLQATGDSVGVLWAARVADPDADLAFLRVLALEQFGQMQGTLETLADLMRQYSPDNLPTDSIRAYLSGFSHSRFDFHLRPACQ